MQRNRILKVRRRERGVTMVAVMLLVVSLLTIGLMVVKSSVREVNQAGQLVARERALMVAQAVVDLAAARYSALEQNDQSPALHFHLNGFNPQAGARCTDPCGDCIPKVAENPLGQRSNAFHHAINNAAEDVDCNGRPCMRQGAVINLADAAGTVGGWCNKPFRDLVPNGDPDAIVSAWVRNNTSEVAGAAFGGTGKTWTDIFEGRYTDAQTKALDPAEQTAMAALDPLNDPDHRWLIDLDHRIVVTAMVTVNNSTVTIEQEVIVQPNQDAQLMKMPSPDEGYGGGHNNDNTAVSVCKDEAIVVNN